MDIQYEERTAAEIERILGFAKLDATDVKRPIQCLNFSHDLDNEAIKLLEIDSDVAKELQEGQRVVIRGLKTDSAVLCTRDKTYDIKDTETSNSLLILPECDVGGDVSSGGDEFTVQHRQVCGIKHEYYELRLVKPRLQMMKELLEQNPYSGPECEHDDQHQGNKYTYENLIEMVQASEMEINQGLVDLQACSICGDWRLLDFDFLSKVFTDLVALKEEQDWEFDAVPASQCCDILEDIYPREIVAHVLRCYADLPEDEPFYTENKLAERQTYHLNEDKICRFFAELLLRPVDQFNLSDFCDTWQQAVPEGTNTSLYQLEGVALVERDTKPEVIRYFPVTDLPEDVAQRFDKLYRTKTKWSLEDITPYLRDLCSEKVAVSGLLAKYARASTQSGMKVYSSKKPLS